MKISDYKDEINKIEPSESFISETEKLMKQMRDGRNIEVKRSISVTSAVLRSAAAAAAVLVCAAAVRFYTGNRSPAQDIAGGEMTSSGETTSSAAADIYTVIPGEIASETAAEETAVPDGQPAISEETAAPADNENVLITEAPAEEAPAEETLTVTSVAETAAQTTAAETDPAMKKDTAETTAASIPAETTVTSKKYISVEEEFIQSTVTSQSAPDTAGSYDSAEAEENYAEIYEYSWADPPINLHDMDDQEVFEEAEDEFEESDGSGSSPTYYGGYGGTGNAYHIGASGKLTGTEEVYVPDSINGLENGTYYMDITAGFDSVDEETGNITGGSSAVIASSEEKQLEGFIRSVDGVAYRSSAEYSDKAAGLSSYRYRIEICSAQDGENGAVMFEIMYDRETLVINRYDNGSESSGKYSIPESDSRMLDSLIGSMIQNK